MIFLAKDFKNREGLEQYIIAEVGQDSIQNKISGHTLTGTKEELKKLNLDDLASVFGIKVIITDFPTKDTIIKKPK